ncbi:MAG: DNA adenine methylase [Gemmatimonadota bacterium]|nr:DNA adenine methylase [Gemmatimonadota bacterium]
MSPRRDRRRGGPLRYIGNKTRLLPFLLRALERLEIGGTTACDPFAGTASVGRALKCAGWRVHSGDVLALSRAFQVARVVLDAPPRLAGGVREALALLAASPPEHGFVTEHYSPAGAAAAAHGRMYFTPENAGRIDAIRERIDAWSEAGEISDEGCQYLLAVLIRAADRVANTTGVYASFVKTWQPNALRPLELRPIRPAEPGSPSASGCTAFQGRAEELLRDVGPVDLLYLDPPYNERQYPGYYHLPELLARGWRPVPALRGKTGLIPDDELRSDWCRRAACEGALERTLRAAGARHVLLSYNDEGLIPAGRVEEILRSAGDPDSYRRLETGYRRYRSDADGPGRRYTGDRVRERLHYVRLA